MSVKPWDIYAKQLLPLGYGHPLWMPEPNSGREVFIGDVGWLKAGEFRALFNSMECADHPANQEKKVPLGFQVFRPSNLSIRKSAKITHHTVFSRSIHASEVRADASAAPTTTGPMSGDIGWRFQTGADGGALLLLNPPGVAEEIESRRHIINYMRDNFDSWLEFANASNSWGLDLRPEDITFVCETVKATKWAVAAFQGRVFRNKEGYVSGQLGAFGNAGISVHISDQLLPNSHYRSGPPSLTPMSSEQHLPSHSSHNALDGVSSSDEAPASVFSHDTSAGVSPGAPDQCLFIHYYKMKRRLGLFWKEPMQASAGPHQLPPGPENADKDATTATVGEGSPMDESEPEFHTLDDVYDPVTHLLDYILEASASPYSPENPLLTIETQTSEADIAIASDIDLISIFRDREIPSNIAEAIIQLSPSIEVDENGVGTISVDYKFVKNRGDKDEQMNEDNIALETVYQTGIPQGSIPTSDGPSTPRHAHMNLADLFAGPMPVHHPTAMEGVQPSGIHSSMRSPTQTFPHPPQGVALLPPPWRVNSLQTPDYNDDDHYSDDNNDVTMATPGDATSDTRPGWSAPTTVHDGSVSALAYSADDMYLASGSEDSTIIIWDARNNAAWQRAPQQGDQGHEDTISALAFSRDHMYLASASLDEKVVVWRVTNGRQHMLIDVGHAIHSLAYTPDGRYLVGGADDGTLHLWDAQTYAAVGTLRKNQAVVTFIIFSPDGHLMATGGMDRVCYVWETANLLGGGTPRVLQGHRGLVCAAAFSPDSSRIITGSDDSSCRIWNALTGEALVVLHEHTGQVCSVAFSPDGRRVASGSDDSTVKVCNSYTGELLISMDGHEQDSIVNMVEFSPDGQYIASAASDSTVRLWNSFTGAVQKTYNEHNANVAMVMFARDGSTLASGSHDGTVFIRPLTNSQ